MGVRDKAIAYNGSNHYSSLHCCCFSLTYTHMLSNDSTSSSNSTSFLPLTATKKKTPKENQARKLTSGNVSLKLQPLHPFPCSPSQTKRPLETHLHETFVPGVPVPSSEGNEHVDVVEGFLASTKPTANLPPRGRGRRNINYAIEGYARQATSFHGPGRIQEQVLRTSPQLSRYRCYY